MANENQRIEQAYVLAKERYGELGVDADRAIRQLAAIPISLHCWQGDDVGGFENTGDELGGGLAVTGNYPGKARTPDELRADFDMALSVIPGPSSLESARQLCRDRWAAGGAQRAGAGSFSGLDRLGPGAAARHGLQSDLFRPPQGRRRLHAGASGRGDPPVLDRPRHRLPPDRRGDRQGTADAVRHQRLDPGRLQGHAGRPTRSSARLPESWTPSSPSRSIPSTTWMPSRASCSASARRVTWSVRTSSTWATPSADQKLLCLDAGHFHPTEVISDKISSVLLYLDEILLHVSRGVRWDSDHVVTLTDELRAIAQEIVRDDHLAASPHRAGFLRRQHQSGGRLGDRHTLHDQGAADGAAGAD